MSRRRFRRLLSLVSLGGLLAVLPAVAAAAEAGFVRLWPGWREAESFDRIGEFLGGPEPVTGARTLLRTQPAARAGYYFLLRVNTPAALAPGTRFVLAVIRPDAPEPREFTFPVTGPAGDLVFDLGVTGTDWPGGKKASPVAWKLSLVGPEGRVLVEHRSFLWEKPAK